MGLTNGPPSPACGRGSQEGEGGHPLPAADFPPEGQENKTPLSFGHPPY